jgi:lysophospholipase L1-like esterase
MSRRQRTLSRGSMTGRRTGRARRLMALLAVSMLVVGACSSAASSQLASPAASAPIAAASQSQTPRPTTAPIVSPSPTIAGPHLTYVALGDSLLYALEGDCDSCTSAAVTYGKQIETDLGIPVEVHNLTMHNGLKSAGLLGYLENGARIGRIEEDVLEAVAAADIVSVTIGFNDSTLSDKDNLPAFLKSYEANLDGILSRIDALRGGKPTMVRVTQIYNNGIAEKPELDPDGPGSGVNGWKPIVEAQNKVICDVAAKHNAVCVDIYHPYNGEDGLSSPASKGYLGPDGTHPSQLGMDVIAKAMAATGYAPLK